MTCCRDQGDELQHLKLLYADLQREMEILKTRSESIQTLKTEVHHLGRQVLQVRPMKMPCAPYGKTVLCFQCEQ